MKIAILISGEYRNFSVCRKNMSGIIDSPMTDIYFSTWDKTVYKNPKIHLHLVEPVTESMIRTAVGKDVTIEIESSNSVVPIVYNHKMIHRWKSGFDLIKKSGIEYDRIILTRPDIYYNPVHRCNLRQILKYDNCMGMAWTTTLHLGILNDVVMIASYEIMEKFIDSLDIEDWRKNSYRHWHPWLGDYIKSLSIPIVPAPEFDDCIFCRVWAKSEHSYDDIKVFHDDWRDLLILHNIDIYGRDSHSANGHGRDILINAEKKWENNYFKKYMI